MFGIIVIGHGGFAGGLASAVTAIVGPQQHLVALDFAIDEDEKSLETRIEAALADMQLEQYLIFTDLLGGTPFKTAAFIARKSQAIEVLAGANLAMLLEAVTNQGNEDGLAVLARKIKISGQSGIVIMTELISQSAKI